MSKTQTTSGSSFSWAYQPNSNIGSDLHVAASVAGSVQHDFRLDTGSCGIAIGRSQVTAPYNVPSKTLPTSQLKYLPSNVTLTGQWTPGVPVVLQNPGGTGNAYANPTVFIVDTPQDWDGGMMGVGLHPSDPSISPMVLNPLLQAYVDGSGGKQQLSAGYIITPDCVQIGLTPDNQTDFAYVPLTPTTNGWTPPQATITLSGGDGLFPNALNLELGFLMDTGVDCMMLFAPTDQMPTAWQNAGAGTGNQIVIPADVTIAVTMPSSGTPLLQYSFNPGVNPSIPAPFGPPEAPTEAIYMGNGGGVNTGIHVLKVFDYLFDAVSNRMGFRKRA